MRLVLIAAGPIATALPLSSQAAPPKSAPIVCASPSLSKRDLARCMVDQSSAAVAHMLRSYNSVLNRLTDRKARADLAAAQRSWEKFKTDDCYFFGGGMKNGSVPAANYSHCLATLAEARARELDSWPLSVSKDLSSAATR